MISACRTVLVTRQLPDSLKSHPARPTSIIQSSYRRYTNSSMNAGVSIYIRRNTPSSVLSTGVIKRHKFSVFPKASDPDSLTPRELITDIINKNDPEFTLKAISRGWAANVCIFS